MFHHYHWLPFSLMYCDFPFIILVAQIEAVYLFKNVYDQPLVNAAFQPRTDIPRNGSGTLESVVRKKNPFSCNCASLIDGKPYALVCYSYLRYSVAFHTGFLVLIWNILCRFWPCSSLRTTGATVLRLLGTSSLPRPHGFHTRQSLVHSRINHRTLRGVLI